MCRDLKIEKSKLEEERDKIILELHGIDQTPPVDQTPPIEEDEAEKQSELDHIGLDTQRESYFPLRKVKNSTRGYHSFRVYATKHHNSIKK